MIQVVALHDQPRDVTGEVNDIPVHYLALRNLYWPHAENRPAFLKPAWHALDIHNPWMARALERVASAFAPDVVHTHNLGGYSSAAWNVARRHARGLVHTLRDYHVLCVRSNMFRDGRNCPQQCLRCAAFSRWRRGPSRHVDAVVGVSRVVLDEHLRAGYFAGAHTTVIGNPVPRATNVAPPPRLRAPITFGYIGRLLPEKGLELLASAYAEIRGSHALLIAGRGDADFERQLRGNIERLGAEFTGWMDQREFYSRVDVVLVPSLWREPFGRTVVEAWQHGRPVLTTPSGGPADIVQHHVTGWIVEPRAEAWRVHLQALVDDPGVARRMDQACRRAAEDFTSDRIALQYERLYEDVLARRAVSAARR
jgi:glycosyltransferase involved in cell wall biosynthesis